MNLGDVNKYRNKYCRAYQVISRQLTTDANNKTILLKCMFWGLILASVIEIKFNSNIILLANNFLMTSLDKERIRV